MLSSRPTCDLVRSLRSVCGHLLCPSAPGVLTSALRAVSCWYEGEPWGTNRSLCDGESGGQHLLYLSPTWKTDKKVTDAVCSGCFYSVTASPRALSQHQHPRSWSSIQRHFF